ncbi:hypothetical protein [Desulfitobacterium sp.]|uniref:ribonuclease toxin HepT-like protein n=1 Tax=Desulfitobacterium sp. TaxID=49981 RepID=UPI002B8BCB94|nr:hypothetical protein [Desulfitobacterium sp.]HVJ49983.1 hypothetical protein [Desulfitobacterium sp.]
MTSGEKKIIRYHKLIGDLQVDMDSIKKLRHEIDEIALDIEKIQGAIPSRDLISCAAFIHHFYTGVESMFERIARVIDGGASTSGDYHRELVSSMSYEIPNIRPAIISLELAEELDEYRRFRHMFRHAYGSELRWRKMQPLVAGIPNVMCGIEEAYAKMVQFTEQLIKELS